MRLHRTPPAKQAALLACVLLNLGACTTQDSIHATGTSLKRIFAVEPKKPFRPHPVAEAYCYRTQSDILCYREPKKGMEVQYVARQPTETVGVAVIASDKVPPSVEEIHRGLPDAGFPPGRIVTSGAAQEAVQSYQPMPFGRAASFNSSSTNSSTVTSSNGSSYVTSASTTVATNKGPRVLMPNQ